MVDFKKLSAISNAARAIVREQYPKYDQWEAHAFQLGFADGSRRSGKYRNLNKQQLLEKAAMECEDQYFNKAQRVAYAEGYSSGVFWDYNPNKTVSHTPEDIERLVHLYVPDSAKELVFFRVVSPIKENETGKNAHAVMGETKKIDADVYSRGIVIDKEHGRHKVLYEHSSITGSGYNYKTILGRELSELSGKELDGIHQKLLDDLSKKGSLLPAVITEVIDEDELLFEEGGYIFEVAIDCPFDQEQEALADRYGCETIDQATNTVLFADFDDAVNYAYEDIHVLERRGDHYLEQDSDGRNVFHVTFNSANPGLVDLARQHNGDADVKTLGKPVVMAYFEALRDAKAYRDDVRNLEERAVNAVVERACDPRAKALTDSQRALVGAYLLSDGATNLKEASGTLQKLLDLAGQQPKYRNAPDIWKGDVLCELTQFLGGKIRDTQLNGLHR